MSAQITIRHPVRFAHKGILTGRPTSVRLKPAPADSGIVFNGVIPALLPHAFVEQHFVGLHKDGEAVLAVEHLLAACYGLGIDNLQVEVSGGEVPFGDGSALPFARILQAAGLKHLRAARRVQSVRQAIVVHQAESFLCVLPLEPDGDTIRHRVPILDLSCVIRFPGTAVGEQMLDGRLDESFFLRELCPARTFGYQEEGELLPTWLARTARVRDGMAVPVKPRFANEPVRHKTLDLLGDLALLGRRLQARVFAYRTGHKLHHLMLKELEDQWT